MRNQQRWQDWAMLVLGLWLLSSPFFIAGGSLSDGAAWNSYILGGSVSLVAMFALFDSKLWEEWVNLTLGLWLVAAPFAMAFYHTENDVAWNQIVLGALIAVDATWVLVQKPTASRA